MDTRGGPPVGAICPGQPLQTGRSCASQLRNPGSTPANKGQEAAVTEDGGCWARAAMRRAPHRMTSARPLPQPGSRGWGFTGLNMCSAYTTDWMSTGPPSPTGSPMLATRSTTTTSQSASGRCPGADRARFEKLKALAFSDPLACAHLIRSSSRIPSDLASKTAGYMEHVAPDLFGVDRLPRRLRRGRMRVVGSGVVEKHQDLLVKRRMKGKGMRWTREGADHLLALQARRHCGRWPDRWGVIAA